MTMLAAKLLLMALDERLNAPFGGNLASGSAAERLAREASRSNKETLNCTPSPAIAGPRP